MALETPLLFVLGDAPLEAVLDESLLVGFERFAGTLEGGMEAWRAAELPRASAELIAADRALDALADGATLLDVREAAEFAAGHVQGAVHVPLGSLGNRRVVMRRSSRETRRSARGLSSKHHSEPGQIGKPRI